MTRQFEIRIDGRPAFRADRYVYSYKNLDAEDAPSVEIAAAGPHEYVVDLMDVEVLPGLTLRPMGEPDEGNVVAWLNMELATAKSKVATLEKAAEHHRAELQRRVKIYDGVMKDLGDQRTRHAETKRALDSTRQELTIADERYEALEGTLLRRGQMLADLRKELDRVTQQRDVAYRDRDTWKGRHAEAEEARAKAVRLARVAEDSRDEWRKLSEKVTSERNAAQRGAGELRRRLEIAETQRDGLQQEWESAQAQVECRRCGVRISELERELEAALSDRQVWAGRYEAAEKSHLEKSKMASSRWNELLKNQGELITMDQKLELQQQLIAEAWKLIQPVRSNAKASFKADWQEAAMYWAMSVREVTPQSGDGPERETGVQSAATAFGARPGPLEPKEAHETLQRATGGLRSMSEIKQVLLAEDDREWRVGQHYGIHLYAVNECGEDEPVATALKPGFAAQIVREHEALRKMSD